ncbi:MAG: hypothetical protein AAF702_44340 [Chloroflexota bacterium]
MGAKLEYAAFRRNDFYMLVDWLDDLADSGPRCFRNFIDSEGTTVVIHSQDPFTYTEALEFYKTIKGSVEVE